MYPNASDTRKLLMWVVEKIQSSQKVDPIVVEGGASKTTNLDDAISRELTSLLQSTWTPLFAVGPGSKQYHQDSYSISSKKITYPHRGRKAKATLGNHCDSFSSLFVFNCITIRSDFIF